MGVEQSCEEIHFSFTSGRSRLKGCQLQRQVQLRLWNLYRPATYYEVQLSVINCGLIKVIDIFLFCVFAVHVLLSAPVK